MARDRLAEDDRVWYVGPEDGDSPRIFPRSGMTVRRGVEAPYFDPPGGVHLPPTLMARGSTGKVVKKAYGCVQVNWGDENVQWCPRAFLASLREFRQWEASQKVGAR